MKNYIAILRSQAGCDYTIGCGIKIHEISANTIQDAEIQMVDLIRDYYGDFSNIEEYRINGCEIFEIGVIKDVDVEWYRNEHLKHLKHLENIEKKKIEQAEKDLLAKLKKKYE